MHKMIFACYVSGQRDLVKALILAESIRTFAGEYSAAQVWLMVPSGSQEPSTKIRAKIEALQVNLHPFKIDSPARDFPFAGKTIAAAAAESLAPGQSEQMVWMDTLSMVINPPQLLLLNPGTTLGYRPVDHLLIGSPYEKPLDPFWDSVYKACGVMAEDIFPMITSADQIKIRPYLNAGMLVVRPQANLLNKWADAFLNIYQEDRFVDFSDQKRLYRIFIHQAVLSAVAISSIDQAEMSELSYLVNYPLHMHAQYPADRRPKTLNEVISFRYEGFFSKTDWEDRIQVEPPLKQWLAEREGVLSRR